MTRTSKLRFNFLAICYLFLSSFSLNAQDEVTLYVDTQYSADEVITTISAVNFKDILGFQYSINWNKDALEFVNAEAPNIPFFIGSNYFADPNTGNTLTCAWPSPGSTPTSINDLTTLMKIKFLNKSNTTNGEVVVSNSPIIIEFVKLINGVVTTVPVLINGGTLLTEGAFVSGKVVHDADEDCELDATETGLAGWRITVGDYHTFTNSEGNYNMLVPFGDYEATASAPSDAWATCTNTFPITAAELGETISWNIPAQAEYECTELNVGISAPLLRRCFPNHYYVNYSNYGTEVATSAYIEVALDDAFTYLDSSLPLNNQAGNLLTFNVGDVGIGETGQFNIKVQSGCDDVELGETHCTEARIYPNEPCEPASADWSGASIQLRSECDSDNDEVRFYIENIGTGDMSQQGFYIVIEDDIIMRNNVPYQLNAGETLEVNLEANGKTYRIETDQVPAHPGLSMPSLAVEGCGRDAGGNFSTGYVMQFDQDDANPNISIDCQENIGSYDPNDKRGFPLGVSDEHYIEENTPIEYFIRFQNTGTDTAFNVVVRDTLSEFINSNSVRISSYSHNLNFQQEDNILIFNFDNIMLPDSNINEAASHGFVRFHVAQVQDNPLGTVINNETSIYFDFNDPIVTNTTMHTIGEDFIEINDPTNLDYIKYPNLELKLYPNPFVEMATIELLGVEETNLQFYLYDNLGRLVRQENFNDSILEFHKNNLNSGTYHYEIRNSKNHIATGQIVIH